MKVKNIIITAALIVATAWNANAQLFIGGGIGIDYAGGKTKTGGTATDLAKTFIIDFSPRVGYWLTDKFAVGLQPGIYSATRKFPENNSKTTYIGWSTNAFARYKAITLDKFALLLEGATGTESTVQKTTTGNTTVKSDPHFFFNMGILPVLSYSITDRLSVQASSDILRLSFVHAFSKIDATGESTHTNVFGFGVNTARNYFDAGVPAEMQQFRLGVIFNL
jgi:outer membrane protein